MWGKQSCFKNRVEFQPPQLLKAPWEHTVWELQLYQSSVPRSRHLMSSAITMGGHKNITECTGRGEKQQSFSWHCLTEPSVLLHGSVCRATRAMPRGCSINTTEACFTLYNSKEPPEIPSPLCFALFTGIHHLPATGQPPVKSPFVQASFALPSST